jgi:putative addiction module killer protein
MNVRVEEYIRSDGSNPYADWFNGLDAQAAAKVATAKLRMELGNTSKVKWFSGIGEYVIDWGPGYRIYLAKDGDSLIVLFGEGPNADSKRISRRPSLFMRNTKRERPRPGRRTKASDQRGNSDGTDSGF